MERIQEAIAKARAERQGNIGRSPAPAQEGETGTAERATAPAPATAAPAAPPAAITRQEQAAARLAESAGVTYTRTRSVELDDARLKEHRVIAGFEYDERVESYRQLRTQVLKILRDNQWNTLAVTSAHENAGKTLTAVNLAVSISREVNQTVLLVDLDLRKPSVQETLGIEVEYGIVDYLQGDVTLDKVLVNPGYQRLVVLPGRALGKYSSEILSSPAMRSLLTDLRNRYESRIIVFDLPPLLRNDDAMIFSHMVDATLMVVEDGVTTESDIERSRQLLEGSNVIGFVLNKAR